MAFRVDSTMRYSQVFILILMVLPITCLLCRPTRYKLRRLRVLQMTARGFGQEYGTNNNSTVPTTDEVGATLNVRPLARAPGSLWKFAWRTHGFLLPLLHFRDPARAKDTDQNLKVLWNKALASFDQQSPVFDAHKWTYDVLPSSSRWILRAIPTRFFPRLHHANIELRTTYLDRAIKREMDNLPVGTNVRLVSLGAGYDTRSVRFLTNGTIQDAWELDLPEVVESKRIMLEQLRSRRRSAPVLLPQIRAIDLNELDALRATLGEIVREDKPGQWHTIFVSEAVMAYLDKDIPKQVLKLLEEAVRGSGGTTSLCFADRLEDVSGGDEDAGRTKLAESNWDLVDWRPKPGLACHMGIARSLDSS